MTTTFIEVYAVPEEDVAVATKILKPYGLTNNGWDGLGDNRTYYFSRDGALPEAELERLKAELIAAGMPHLAKDLSVVTAD